MIYGALRLNLDYPSRSIRLPEFYSPWETETLIPSSQFDRARYDGEQRSVHALMP